MKSSPTKPTLTAAIGPINGIFASSTAREAPVTASTSGGTSSSIASVVATTCKSSRSQLGNRGRSGRSTKRLVRIAFSGGRPSRRKNPPGILPTAYSLSS